MLGIFCNQLQLINAVYLKKSLSLNYNIFRSVNFESCRIFLQCKNLEHRNPREEGSSRRSEGSTWEDVDWVFPQLLFAGCFRLLLHEKCSTESFVPVSVTVYLCVRFLGWEGGGPSTPPPFLFFPRRCWNFRKTRRR